VSDVFQEVEEEYRRQQLSKVWEQYRLPIIGGATALILGVAGFQAWSYWNGLAAEKSSRELETVAKLLQAGPGSEKDAADRLAKVAHSGSGGYRILAQLQEAGVRAELRDFKAAVKLYDEIVRTSREPMFRDFAAIRAVVLLSESEDSDKLKARLEPVAKVAGPWQMSAKELLAYVTWRGGKTDDALKIYDEIGKADDVPNGIKRRSIEMVAVIRAGLKPSDVKPPTQISLPTPDVPTPGLGPLLLQPTTPAPEQPGSLLGPAPVVPNPVPPSPAEPATPTP
jgi:hypothetical protein